MSEQPLTRWKHLARKPGSHYRQLFVKGTRIAAWVLYSYHVEGEDWPGQTAEEIAEAFKLPIEAVREAIAYCQSDPPDLHEDARMEDAVMEAGGMNDPSYKLKPTPKPLSLEDHRRIYRR
ncbi:MAG: DUF433 domain-containing protein [Planctomycetes bacterium]|nr:DUF433 domain-containing protein [Planctomycetota bacterium]